jgi:hypothetical protein
VAAYCTKDDLLTGDIPLAGKYGDGSTFVQLAADEIDAQIGHLYVTPVVFAEPNNPRARPAQLLLKKINTLLASGRIVLDMAAGSEDQNLHAYGNAMLMEGVNLLNMISSQKIKLVLATEIDEVADDENTAISIVQDDPYSLVESFYTAYSRPAWAWPSSMPVRPYDDETVTP